MKLARSTRKEVEGKACIFWIDLFGISEALENGSGNAQASVTKTRAEAAPRASIFALVVVAAVGAPG
jgi:hypothetical protein